MNLSDDSKSYGNPFKTFFKAKNTKKTFVRDSFTVENSGTKHVLDELTSSSRANFYS